MSPKLCLEPFIFRVPEKAKNTKKLVFSIAWQHSTEDLWDNLDEFKDDKRFKVVDIDYKESKGACWARNQLQQNYKDEEYTLQLDSHHRFVENWQQLVSLQVKISFELINLFELETNTHKWCRLSGDRLITVCGWTWK